MKYIFFSWSDRSHVLAKSSEDVVTYNPKFILELYGRNELPFRFSLPDEEKV